MDKLSLTENIRINNDIECPFQIGFEKEFLITALSPNGNIYNLLDISEDIIKCTEEIMAQNELFLTAEYSRSLLEIVTIPFSSDDALRGLEILNSIYADIHNYLKKFSSKYKSLGAYILTLSDKGSSPSHEYISKQGEIFSGNSNQLDFVLEKYKSFVEKNQNISWIISSEIAEEKFISTYNHISSFHITFHPSYRKDGHNLKRYLQSLQNALTLIDIYRPQDVGNNQIQRLSKLISLKDNLRDLFLEKLFELVYKDIPNSIHLSANNLDFNEEYFTNFSMALLKINLDSISFDEVYSKWPGLNLRPRIINGMFAIEIRAFGSNFSHIAHRLIQDIIRFDQMNCLI